MPEYRHQNKYMDGFMDGTAQSAPVEKPVPKSKQRLQNALEAAQKLVEQRKAALMAIEAREKARANRVPASTINKQKFLIGSFIMETKPGLVQSEAFQAWLKRPQDRSVFGLPELPK